MGWLTEIFSALTSGKAARDYGRIIPNNVVYLQVNERQQPAASPFWAHTLDLNGDLNEKTLPGDLKYLTIRQCTANGGTLELPGSLIALAYIDCPTLPQLPALRHLFELSTFRLSGCGGIATLPELPDSLSDLSLFKCAGLTGLPGLPRKLATLQIEDCPAITELPQPLPATLRRLSLYGCPRLSEISSKLPDVLELLSLIGCRQIVELPSLPSWLKTLALRGCTSMIRLPAPLPPRLGFLHLEDCESLTELPELPQELEYLYLPGCHGLDHLPQLPRSLRYVELSVGTPIAAEVEHMGRSLPNLKIGYKYPTLKLVDTAS